MRCISQQEIHKIGKMIEEHGLSIDDHRLFKLVIDTYIAGKDKSRRSAIGFGRNIERKINNSK